MKKSTAVVLLVVMALIVGGASLHAQNGGAPGRGAAALADTLPQRTAKAFAPFIRAILTRRFTTAQQLFKVRRSVLTSLEQSDTLRIMGRFQKPDTLSLNLIGGRMLGQNIGILLFTIANEDGPVYFKIYYYGVNDDIYVDRMDVGDEWDDLEAASISVQQLNDPITVSLAPSAAEEGGQ